MTPVKTIEILLPGPLTTVQDLGRFGYGRYGVPPSGAVDTFSLRVANLLAGNPEGEACLEITMTGLKAKVLTDVVIAVTGGNLQPSLNGVPLPMWQAYPARSGDVLFFAGRKSGCRSYLAVGGGIGVEPVMGSRSTNLSSAFGGHEGRPLRKGDILFSESPRHHLGNAEKSFHLQSIPVYREEWLLRVLPGPQQEEFSLETRELFLSSVHSVTRQSDRAGIRLSGPALHRRDGLPESIVSEGVVPGAIQVPGDGQPIIILVETVTGGYRKIANVISADLPLLGQIRPGDRMRFQQVSPEAALDALWRAEEVIRSLG